MDKIYSMTGFSSEKILVDKGELSCEVRSLNSRYLEIFVKLPLVLRELEDSIKEIIRSKVSRGKISCSINLSLEEPLLELKVNQGAVRMYKELLKKIQGILELEQSYQISDILQFKDIFASKDENNFDEPFKQTLIKLIENTLDQLNITRAKEGENLLKDILERLNLIQELSKKISELGKKNSQIEFDKLYRRLLSLIKEQKIDQNRLEMELALISDRVDISEEVVRLHSHIKLFRENLMKGSPIGKKLNFILQEMHREANTISSKNTLIDISRYIVAIKEDIERIREQIQNIE